MKSARRIFSLLLGLTALLVVSSCSFIPLFDVQIIDVKVNSSNQFLGVSVTFSARFDNAESYEWDFGDGSTGTGQVVTHFYNTTGIFTVMLRVVNNGNTFVFSKEVNILSSMGTASGPSEIVFECKNGPGNNDLCGINFDGSGFQVLLEIGSEINSISDPKMNASGQVVFECAVAPATSVDSLCGINSDGTGFRIIRLITAGATRSPDINDAGEIVYECLTPSTFISSLCGIEFDGSNFHVIDDAAGDNTQESEDPSINNAGQVAYTCENGVNNQGNLCVNTFTPSGRVVLDTDLTSINFVTPTINSSGQIAYVCENVSGWQSLCVINFDGTGQNMITDAASTNDEDITPVINDSGQIAYDCELDVGSSQNSLCAIEFGGGGQAIIDQANNDADENTRPAMDNSDRIAYQCQLGIDISSLCTINFDGTGFAILRNSLGDSDMTSSDPAVP